MTKFSIDEIREALRRKMVVMELSGNQAAKQIGVSPATVSNMLLSIYEEYKSAKISDTMWRKVAAWAGYGLTWRSVDLPGYKRVMDICRHAQNKGISKAIADEPGSGKTWALTTYASCNVNCYFIACKEHWTVKNFIEKLMQAIGMQVFPGTITEKVDAVVDFLNSKQSPLLIVDEADKLRDRALIIVKTLYDEARTGIVLAGTPYFEIRILRGCRSNKMGYKEIFSRVGGEFYHLGAIGTDEVFQICLANDIHEEKVIRAIAREARGDLRRVKSAIELYELQKEKITKQEEDTA
ncbi:MAG: ATP-binding protein [Aliivibrio sp.]|uniref:AAA family ATPase n=1 Tax=Aliivibrio sp. TaxID=1872443 RepID=UPI001A5B3393|nr:ATP-binding protein [Aliivibrio sp.]